MRYYIYLMCILNDVNINLWAERSKETYQKNSELLITYF